MQPKSGWRTSEFWLGIFAIVATQLVPVLDNAVQSTTTSIATHNTGNVWGMLGPAVISMAYAIGRSYVKGQTAQADAAASVVASPTAVR